MPLQFNPRKKKDDKGTGKIQLDGKTETAQETAAAPSAQKWILIGGATVLISLGTIFALSSRKTNETPEKATPKTEQVEQKRLPEKAETAAFAESIRQKQSVIYRDDAAAYKDEFGGVAEGYFKADGTEAREGQDFDLHATLFNKGGISLLVASGPYAGARIEIMPAPLRANPYITYTQTGREISTEGGVTLFESIPAEKRTSQTVSMKTPAVAGNGVSVSNEGTVFELYVREDNTEVLAYKIKGSVEKGVFSIELWNGDLYDIDLKTGDYAFDSIFLNHPGYKSGDAVDRNDWELIKGVITVAPAVKPQKTLTR